MKRFGLFICFAVMMANIVSAQALKTYEGAMKLPSELKYLSGVFSSCYSEYNCKGSYQYYDGDDGERVRHGDFNFMSVPPIGTHNFGLTGHYNHGKMDGEWIAARINNKGEMILPSWGKDYISMFLINYKEGAISGRYELIGASNGGMYITHYTGNIVNGIIQGNVSLRKIQNKVITDITLADTCTMTGEVGADGMPIGVWTIIDKGDIDKIQRRFFHKGVLVAIDELDNSTGERKLCYCAFEGLKKAPKMEEIKDSISGGVSYIVYNGQSAIKVKDDEKIRYNSNLGRYSLGNSGINVVVPEEIKRLSKSVNQQTEMWMYVYSETKLKEIQEKKRKERERFVQDSIRDRQRMIERANRDIDYEFDNYTSYIPAKMKIIKKSYMEGSDVVFKTKSEVFRGEFKKEYMKNSMGEIYHGEYNVLSNKTGDIMLVKFIWSAEVVVCLIDKRADKVVRYKVMPSALKGLPLIW